MTLLLICKTIYFSIFKGLVETSLLILPITNCPSYLFELRNATKRFFKYFLLQVTFSRGNFSTLNDNDLLQNHHYCYTFFPPDMIFIFNFEATLFSYNTCFPRE